MKITEICGTAAVAAYTLYFLLFLLLHLKNGEYRFTKHAVSDYDIGSTHHLFQFYNLSGAAGGIALAAAFYFHDNGILHNTVPVLFGFMIFCRSGLALFQTAIEGQKLTATAALHYLFATISFALSAVIILVVDSHVIDLNYAGLDSVSGLINAYDIFLLCILLMTFISMFRPLRFFFGIFERIYILSAALWFMAAGMVFAFKQ